MTNKRLSAVAATLFVVGFVWYHWLRLSSLFGTAWDDGGYLVGAKALAQGLGYRLLQHPDGMLQIGFPPLYPAVLSLVWQLWPDFPQNLWAFKGLNILAGLVTVGASFVLVTRGYGAPRWQGVLVAVMLSLSTVFVTFIDTTMSEMVYMAVLMVALLAAERVLERPEHRPIGVWVGLAALVTLPFLTRTAGLALGLSVIGLLLLRRHWRPALMFTAAFVAWNLPWQLWVQYVQRSQLVASWSYGGWLQTHTGGFQAGMFLTNMLENAQTVVTTSLPLMLAPVLKSGLLAGLLDRLHLTGWVPLLIAGVLLLTLAGYGVTARRRLRVFHLFLLVSFLMILPYPYRLADTTRYVASLSPLLLYALVAGAAALGAGTWLRSGSLRARLRPVLVAMAAGVIMLNVAEGLIHLATMAKSGRTHDALLAPDALAYSRDLIATAGWIDRHLSPDALLLYYREPQIYLLTNRQAVWGLDARPTSEMMHHARNRPTYLVHVPGSQDEADYQAFFRARPGWTRPVFTSPNRVFTVFHVATAAEGKPAAAP